MPSQRRQLLFIFIYSLMSAGCNKCINGIGEVHEEDRILPEFHALSIQGDLEVHLRSQPSTEKDKVTVIAQYNLIPLVTAKVREGVLFVDAVKCTNSAMPLQIVIYGNQISQIDHFGSGQILTDDTLQTDQILVKQQGSGTMNLKLHSKHVEITNNHDGLISLSGKTDKLDIGSYSSGDCNAKELKSREVSVNQKGTGTVSLHVTERLQIDCGEEGIIEYTGEPLQIENNNGKGRIIKIQ